MFSSRHQRGSEPARRRAGCSAQIQPGVQGGNTFTFMSTRPRYAVFQTNFHHTRAPHCVPRETNVFGFDVKTTPRVKSPLRISVQMSVRNVERRATGRCHMSLRCAPADDCHCNNYSLNTADDIANNSLTSTHTLQHMRRQKGGKRFLVHRGAKGGLCHLSPALTIYCQI